MTSQLTYFTGKPCKRGHTADRFLISRGCTECYKIHKKKTNANPKYKAKQKIYRNSTERYRKYGLSNEEYDAMFNSQNGKCKICKNPSISKNLHIDHCHKTKKVRGLLCTSCNTGLGQFKDNPELLRKAAVYCEET